MGSIYSKGDMVKCTRDFVMSSGAVAFKKGKVYSILDVHVYDEDEEIEYEYEFHSEASKGHVIQEKDITRHFKVVEINPIIFHKYYCGCYGIPIDSMNGLIVKACDDDSGEYFMGIRDMTDKKSEPMKWEDQDELIRMISSMLGRGHRVTDFAFLINQIMKKGGE
jgi:hypothetical protein